MGAHLASLQPVGRREVLASMISIEAEERRRLIWLAATPRADLEPVTSGSWP